MIGMKITLKWEGMSLSGVIFLVDCFNKYETSLGSQIALIPPSSCHVTLVSPASKKGS